MNPFIKETTYKTTKNNQFSQNSKIDSNSLNKNSVIVKESNEYGLKKLSILIHSSLAAGGTFH